MKQAVRWQTWMLWAVMTVLVIGAALVVRGRLNDWTRARFRERLLQTIQTLPEDAAAAQVRRLAVLEADAPRVLLPLLTDKRRAVADAAAETLDQLVADWRRLTGHEAAPRISQLATELAAVAPHLPGERIRWAQSLATRLLVWPINDLELSAQVVGNCEVVLRLPAPESGEIRIAAVERPLEPEAVEVVIPQPLSQELPASLPSTTLPDSTPSIPRIYGPVEPERLPDASDERPERPKQFLPPRAMRIDG